MSEVDSAEARRLMEGGAVLIDVREPEEWSAGHAPGAVHRPLGGLAAAPLPAGAPLLLVCRSGARSARAQAELAVAGRAAINVGGGMNAWAAAGLAVVTDDGNPGTII
jgi:rhodanese-related sulfurtransferase